MICKESTPDLHRNNGVKCHSQEHKGMAKETQRPILKRGDDCMKRFSVVIVALVIFCFALTGCSSFKLDKNHASVSLTTSSGQAYLWRSVNGTGMTQSGHDIALDHKSEVVLKKGETATVTFKCDACGDEQVYEISEPWAQTLSCDCPEKIDDKGNAKEYTSISISFEEE